MFTEVRFIYVVVTFQKSQELPSPKLNHAFLIAWKMIQFKFKSNEFRLHVNLFHYKCVTLNCFSIFDFSNQIKIYSAIFTRFLHRWRRNQRWEPFAKRLSTVENSFHKERKMKAKTTLQRRHIRSSSVQIEFTDVIVLRSLQTISRHILHTWTDQYVSLSIESHSLHCDWRCGLKSFVSTSICVISQIVCNSTCGQTPHRDNARIGYNCWQIEAAKHKDQGVSQWLSRGSGAICDIYVEIYLWCQRATGKSNRFRTDTSRIRYRGDRVTFVYFACQRNFRVFR